MEILLALLQAAIVLAPQIEALVPVIRAALGPNPRPLTAADAVQIIGVLMAAEAEVPALAGVTPLVQKAFRGEQFNDVDLATLEHIADAVDAEVADSLGTKT
jgi:predicted component of type VI protein secretion system